MLSPWTIEQDDVEAAMEVYRSLHDRPEATRRDAVRSLLRMMGGEKVFELIRRMKAEPLPEPAPPAKAE